MEAIKKALDEVRPALQEDGGDVEFVSFDEKSGLLKVRFLGHCAGCQFARMTLKHGIERRVRELVPAVKAVEMED